MIYLDYLDSPIGLLYLESSAIGMTKITKTEKRELESNPNPIIIQTIKELREYFQRERKTFNVPIDLNEEKDFLKKVWDQVSGIPYGTTRSYKDLAIELGDAKYVRAVGMANGKNPIPIIIPCHRVIGSKGDLTGYALGIHIKRKLLALENPMSFAENGSLF